MLKIAIASGKGGTGKTTVSTNLAAYLAEKYRINLVDLDVEEPNSALFLNTELRHEEDKYKQTPKWTGACSLCGVCQDVCNSHAVLKLGRQIMVFPELCHSCYACSELCPESALPMFASKMGRLTHSFNERLTFVESRLDIGQEQAVPLIAQCAAYVDEHLSAADITIYDAPPGTACPVIESVKRMDFVILVTEPTPFGLHDLTLAVETVKAMNKPFAVIINRYGIGNDDVLDYCSENGFPVLAKISNDRKIAELYSNGELLYDKIPQVREALKNIENYLLELPGRYNNFKKCSSATAV